MKKFLLHFVCFIIPTTLCLYVIESLCWENGEYKKNIDGREVYEAIYHSKNKYDKLKIKKILIGDSVGKQLFQTGMIENSILFLTSNRAITIAGFYFLLNNYLINNADNIPDEVILFMTPQLLKSSLDQFSYQYFLKPFYNEEYLPLFTDNLYAQCKMIPLFWTSNLPFFRTSNYTVEYNAVNKDPLCVLISQITVDYYYKIIALCNKYNIDVIILAAPISQYFRTDLTSQIESSIKKNELNNLTEQYKKTISYYPDSIFSDHIHLKPNYIKEFRITYKTLIEK